MTQVLRLNDGQFVLMSAELGQLVMGKVEIAAFFEVLDHLGYCTPDADEMFDDLDAMWEQRPVGAESVIAEIDFFIEEEKAAPMAA